MDVYKFSTIIQVPVEAVDLYQWLTNVSDREYQTFSKAHRAMGLFKDGQDEGIINVEDFGGNLLIQHYKILKKSPDELHMYSERSDVYLTHLIHSHVGADWKMSVRHLSDNTCTFLCEVGTILPSKLLELAATISFSSYFLQEHVEEEGQNFADDIERKTIQKMAVV